MSLRLALLALACTAAARPMRRDANVAACLADVGVDVIAPNDSGYSAAARPFNERFDNAPIGIAYPNDGQGVANALLCAAQTSASSLGRYR